jgi:ABC-type multidrug transport system fused ATPase/permease subunit
LVQAEGHTVGSVQSEVYWSYFYAMGNFAFYGLNICNILSIAASLASSMWLGTWSSESGSSNAKPVSFYIGIYVLLSLLTVVFSYICNIIGFDGAVNASATIHKKLVHSLLMAPISFFDSTPLGRITNRMSKDMSQIDSQIMFQFQLLVRYLSQCCNTIYFRLLILIYQ